jgi:hypothetical protein
VLLAVDIGSTNVKLGVYAGATLTQRWRAPTQREALADEWWVTLAELAETARFDLVQLTAACVSSTAPAVTGPFTRMLRERLGLHALVVQAGLDLGLTLAVDFPEQLGPDRLLDAAAGYARRRAAGGGGLRHGDNLQRRDRRRRLHRRRDRPRRSAGLRRAAGRDGAAAARAVGVAAPRPRSRHT